MQAIKKLVEKSLAAEYRLLHDADHSFKYLVVVTLTALNTKIHGRAVSPALTVYTIM